VPQVFGAVVRIRDHEDACPGAAYVEQRPHILDALFEGCVAWVVARSGGCAGGCAGG